MLVLFELFLISLSEFNVNLPYLLVYFTISDPIGSSLCIFSLCASRLVKYPYLSSYTVKPEE